MEGMHSAATGMAGLNADVTRITVVSHVTGMTGAYPMDRVMCPVLMKLWYPAMGARLFTGPPMRASGLRDRGIGSGMGRDGKAGHGMGVQGLAGI